MKATRPRPQPRTRRVPRPILAMAAPPNDTPTVTIDRLKGGEINWSLKTPAPSVGAAITRAMNHAKQLIEGCLELEQLERRRRAFAKAAQEKTNAEAQETGQ